jgi:hypothetical protein
MSGIIQQIKNIFTKLISGAGPSSTTGTGSSSNGALDFVKDILKKSIDPNNKTYDSKIILALLYLLSMVYISEKNAMLNGYLFLIIAYVITIYRFHKDMEYKAFFTYFENSTSIFPTIVFTIVLIMGFGLAFSKTATNMTQMQIDENDKLKWTISLFVILFIGGFYLSNFLFDIVQNPIFKNYLSKIISISSISTIVGIIVYNLYSIVVVRESVAKRTEQVKSYDINISKTRWREFNTYNALFYFMIFAMFLFFYVLGKITSNSNNNNTTPPFYFTWLTFDRVAIAALLIIIISTCVNYVIQKSLVKGLEDDSVQKTEEQKQVEASDAKTANQNIFTNAYYWILNMFNDPSVLMP